MKSQFWINIRCSQVGLISKIRKVVAADDYIIPGLSEAVVNVGRNESDDTEESATQTCILKEHII